MSARKDLMLAIKDRLEDISVANGYRTNIGQDVAYWRDARVDHGRDCMSFRDESATHARENRAQVHRVNVQVSAVVFGEDLGGKMNDAFEDILEALGIDPTFGRSATGCELSSSNFEILGDGYESGAVTVTVELTYRVDPWKA